MEFEWDEDKNQLNQDKHGIRFKEAKEIFGRFVLMWEDTRQDYGEPRFISVGEIGDSVVILLVVAIRHVAKRLVLFLLEERMFVKG